MGGAARVYAAIALGGALGALLRVGASLALAGPAFPWGTLAVNGLGSFLIGVYAARVAPRIPSQAEVARRQFVMAGFCGSFTSLSIFSLETLRLVEAGAAGLAALYVGGSLALWLGAVSVGWRTGVLTRPSEA